MKKIVLIGGECTGKTTLAQQLTNILGGKYVEEYGRIYASLHPHVLTYDDVMPIIQGVLAQESEAEKSGAPCLILDGNPVSELVYSRWYYNRVPDELSQIVAAVRYDYYLLAYPDIAWEADGIRDMPEGRVEIFELFRRTLDEFGCPFSVIDGLGDTRLKNALSSLEKTGLCI